MKPSGTTPSWGRMACATAAAVSLFYPLGMAAALIWVHPLVSFGAFLILSLASLRLHSRYGRVAGVPVEADCVTAS